MWGFAVCVSRSSDYQVGIVVVDLKVNKKGKEVGEGMLIMPQRSRSREESSTLSTSTWSRSAWQTCVKTSHECRVFVKPS